MTSHQPSMFRLHRIVFNPFWIPNNTYGPPTPSSTTPFDMMVGVLKCRVALGAGYSNSEKTIGESNLGKSMYTKTSSETWPLDFIAMLSCSILRKARLSSQSTRGRSPCSCCFTSFSRRSISVVEVNVPGVDVLERASASLPSHNLSFWWPVRSVLISARSSERGKTYRMS